MFSAAIERNRCTVDSMEGQEREGYVQGIADAIAFVWDSKQT
jgi:hypothetical protein